MAIREERKTELNGVEVTKSVEQEVTFDYSLGLGYQLTKTLLLDVFTESGLSSITSWEVGVIFRY